MVHGANVSQSANVWGTIYVIHLRLYLHQSFFLWMLRVLAFRVLKTGDPLSTSRVVMSVFAMVEVFVDFFVSW